MIAEAPLKLEFDTIDDVLADIAAGKLVIVTDDADRENEGDLVMAAEKATPKAVNFMATHGRGLICVPISNERAEQLGLQRMVAQNREMYRTDFTVSVDASKGVTTGISAHDRAATIKTLANPKSTPDDLVQPGHVFPLRAKDGGVLRRAGHTEAAVDLGAARGTSAGRRPLRNPARRRDDGAAAGTDGVPQKTWAADLHHPEPDRPSPAQGETGRSGADREAADRLRRFQSAPVSLDPGRRASSRAGEGKDLKEQPTLVRVHSECLTGDVFGSRRCDCGHQLHAALKQIADEGNGVLLYMRQEGRGIGLAAKIHAYKLQEEGLDTVEANAQLGFATDLRDYGLGAQILFDLGVRKFRFLTNNPKKVVGLEGYGIQMVEQVPIRSEANVHNAKYLETKRTKLGHTL